jgi:hypothetical protein
MNEKYGDIVICFLDVLHHNYVSLTMNPIEIEKCLLILTILNDKEFKLFAKYIVKEEKKGTTFMIYDQKVIVSGRNIAAMEKDYEFILKFITDNRNYICI